MYSCQLSADSSEMSQVQKEMSTALFPIEIQIVKVLYDLCLRGFAPDRTKEWNSNKYWTAQVKECLSRIGNEQGFMVYPVPKDGKLLGQWVFDLIWVDAKRGESGAFDYMGTRGLKLACESEWNPTPDAIMEDFLKLTWALADLRLFVYTNKTIDSKSGDTEPSQLCKRACPTSRGFRYLLVGFPPKADGKFKIDAWIA